LQFDLENSSCAIYPAFSSPSRSRPLCGATILSVRHEPNSFARKREAITSGETIVRSKCALLPILVAIALITPVSAAQAQVVVGVSIRIAPPVLPVYVQPPIPGLGYMWMPGYWAWDPYMRDYYWVPGTWVLAPAVGLLWTPGYWGWRDEVYIWNGGYWGPRVGFYGGINYGYGYTGLGFQGGYWSGGVFAYNRAVTNVGTVQITNVYNKTVINNTTVTNVSFNGGNNGTPAKPTAQEQAAALDKHIPATDVQTKHQDAAHNNRALFAAVNKGNPAIAATSRAGQFSGANVVAAKGVNTLPSSRDALKTSASPPGPKPPRQISNAKGPPPGPKQQVRQAKKPDQYKKPDPK
jgi:hypothetical protein